MIMVTYNKTVRKILLGAFGSFLCCTIHIMQAQSSLVPFDHPELVAHNPSYAPISPSSIRTLPNDWLANEFVQLGYIPVTLLGAIPNDGIDDTDAIENAIILARDWQYATYFPAGVYTISRTIQGRLKSFDTGTGSPTTNRFRADRFFPIQLIGDCSGTGRAVLKLTAPVDGFNTNNPTDATMKPLLEIYAETVSSAISLCRDSYGEAVCLNPASAASGNDPRDDSNAESSASNFNAIIRNIDFDISGGYQSAVAVRFAGAQGCTMENSKIIATDAYAGLTGGLGSGGGYFNVAVEGGQYGFVSLNPKITQELLMTGMRFINQERAVFRGHTFKSHTIVGLYVKKNTPPVIEKGRFVSVEGLSLVDAVIDIEQNRDNEAVFWLNQGNNIYLKNVHVSSNITHIARNTATNAPILRNDNSSFPTGQSWSRIATFAHQKNNTDAFVVWDYGTTTQSTSDVLEITTNATPSPTAIIDKHIALLREAPCPFSGTSTNGLHPIIAPDVTVVPPSRGVDSTLDHDYIQNLIANGARSIFLPRGVYYIDQSILLNSTTTLFGVSKTHSIIKATKVMHKRGIGAPMITTTSSQSGSAYLSDVFLHDSDLDINDRDAYNNKLAYLDWKQGSQSVVLDVSFGSSIFFNSNNPPLTLYDHTFFAKVSDGGGGFWYGVYPTHTIIKDFSRNDTHRGFIADGAQHLKLYSFNYERYGTNAPSSAQVEFKNSSYIDMYLFKTETGGGIGAGEEKSTPFRVTNCQEVSLYTVSGRIEDLQRTDGTIGALLEINNSCTVTATTVKSFANSGAQYSIRVDGNNEPSLLYTPSTKNGFVSALWIGPQSSYCAIAPTCEDGIQNGDETDIDCGGLSCQPCKVPLTCQDGIQNGDETDIDCGGTSCPLCPTKTTVLYPNPVKNILHIHLDQYAIGQVSNQTLVDIIDTTGRIVRRHTLGDLDFSSNTIRIHIATLSEGVYHAVIRKKNGPLYHRFVFKR